MRAKAWNVSSIATVKSWLEQLEAQGYIERLSSSRGQTIKILKIA
jgi:CTP-dependent riboflavin kinase